MDEGLGWWHWLNFELEEEETYPLKQTCSIELDGAMEDADERGGRV